MDNELVQGESDYYDRDNHVFTEVIHRGVTITDFVDEMCEARQFLLAKGRTKIELYKVNMVTIGNRGVAIGVSPSDDALKKYKPEEIKFMTERYLNKRQCCYMLVPDYSDTYRFHYHGVILVMDIDELNKIKRWFMLRLGRTVTEPIKHVKEYVEYCFKIYNNTNVTSMVAEFKPSHVIHSPLDS